jgi:hypothetical protein
MSQPRCKEIALLPKQRLLITESSAEFDAVRRALEQEIRPRGIIERIYVNDISSIVWEILRLRRCKTAIINIGFLAALENLLSQLLKRPDDSHSSVRDQAEALALSWFTDQEARKKVSGLLDQFGLEEFAIEAEAIRRSLSELESIERLLSSLESRRNKSLRCIGQYREGLGRQLREASDRMIDGEDVLRVEDSSREKSVA